MYKAGQPQKSKRKKRIFWLIFWLIIVALIVWGVIFVINMLKPKTVIKQAAPTVKKLTYEENKKYKVYTEPDFTIELPISWKQEPKTTSQYNKYTWTNINKTKNNESITVYEDTIPKNFAENRVVVLEPTLDGFSIKGDVSDNCNTFTKNLAPSSKGAPARWMGVDFTCDQDNLQRDVVGTSSAEAINTISLQSPSGRGKHKFFFTYTNNSINGDYNLFTTALKSFKMQ